MFKFRRSSLCTAADVISPPSSSSEEDEGIAEEILSKKVSESSSESKLARDISDEKESLSESSSDSDANTISDQHLFSTCKIKGNPCQNNLTFLEEKSSGLEENQTLVVEVHCSAGTSGSANTAMLDRKRKERHESTSQEQETKVIRAELSCTESIIDHGEGRLLEKFVQSTYCEEIMLEADTNDVLGEAEGIPCTGSENKPDEIASISGKHQESGFGHGVRTMPTNFEPEKQRQFERTAAPWSARKIRKSYQGYYRPRQAKSSKSSSEVERIINASPMHDHQSNKLSNSHAVTDPVTYCNSVPQSTKSLHLEANENNSENEDEQNENLEVNVDDLARSLHPLDFSTMHHHVDSQEPLTCRAVHYASSDQVILSPRNSIIRTDSIDPSIPPSPPLHQIPVDPRISRQILDGNQDTKINSLTRQISNLKKQLKQLEEEYELLMGYKPSHADKLNNKEMKKYLLQLSKLKKELKQIREDPASLQNGLGNAALLDVYKNGNTMAKEKSLDDLEAAVRCVEKTLREIRLNAKRPEELLRMTQSELLREKAAMQKELIILEKRFGRPDSKEEKEIVRSLYDRYRAVKKMSGKTSYIANKASSVDLAPIMEHETLDFQQDAEIPKIFVALKKEMSIASPKSRRRHAVSSGSESSSSSWVDSDIDDGFWNEDYNEMDANELELKHRLACDEKRKLRMTLRRFEIDFQSQTGRLPQKEEKSGEMELVYQKYKYIRGTIRLLDVLIQKRKFPHSLVDLTKVEVED